MIYVDLFFSHLYSLPAYHQPNLSQRTASFIIIIIENMGTQESFEKNISEYKNSERIGVYRELEDQGRNLVQLSRALPNERVFKEWVKEVEKIRLKNQPNEAIYLPLKYFYKQAGLCGSGGTLHIIFDRWESFLKDEIASRRKNQHFYTQEEVWFILYSIIRVGLIYEPTRTKIGDLHSNNIIVTPEGFIRVITRHSIPLSLTNYEKVVEEINSDVYLAPEQMDQESIERGVYQLKLPSKCDAFSLGMVMLEVATLQNCSYLYIRNPLRISLEKFNSFTNILKDKYSTLLFRTIMSLLQLDPKYRKDMTMIYDILKPYEQQIEELKPFYHTETSGKEVGADSRANSMAPGDRSIDKSSTNPRKRSNVPFSPPTQTVFSFTKNI